MELALYQPDIALNVGAIIRLTTCFDVKLNIIEPCGFPFDIKKIKKSSLDYIEHAKITRHNSFEDFIDTKIDRRIILFTTKTNNRYYEFNYKDSDILLFGRESSGVPQYVADHSDALVTIPMAKHARSLNIGMSAAIGLSHAIYSCNSKLSL